MTTIVFVRHGESQSNVLLNQIPDEGVDGVSDGLWDQIHKLGDPELTELGHNQAKAVSMHLVHHLHNKKVRVLSSLYHRAIQTADAFCKKYAEHIVERDRTDFLEEYTRPQKHLTPEHKQKGLRHHATWKDFTDVIEQFVEILEEMARCSDHPIIIFGHSLYLSVLTSYIGSNKKWIASSESELIFRFPNCSITTFQFSQSAWKVLNVASIAHLKGELCTGTECDYANVTQ